MPKKIDAAVERLCESVREQGMPEVDAEMFSLALMRGMKLGVMIGKSATEAQIFSEAQQRMVAGVAAIVTIVSFNLTSSRLQAMFALLRRMFAKDGGLIATKLREAMDAQAADEDSIFRGATDLLREAVEAVSAAEREHAAKKS